LYQTQALYLQEGVQLVGGVGAQVSTEVALGSYDDQLTVLYLNVFLPVNPIDKADNNFAGSSCLKEGLLGHAVGKLFFEPVVEVVSY
jgi:hypothetical protein